VLCRAVLIACNLLTIYAQDVSIMAGFGALFAAMTGLVTLAVVWLVGVRWLIVPAVLFAAAFTRGWYLNTAYPPPPD
jgi:hypothetical protein